MRLDVYCADNWPEHSRSTWQKLIRRGEVSVNGKVIMLPKFDVVENDRIEAATIQEPDFSHEQLPVLYEDDNVIVINKPVGVLTHSKGALNDEFTVAEFFRPKTTYNLDTDRPGIVHRLDRATSGVLIGAKNAETARLLSQQFQDRRAKKTYLAVLAGIPHQFEAHIDLPIGRNPKAPSTFRADPQGKAAHTYYKVLHTTHSEAQVQLQPTTGRTHQLRVHMAYLNTPIKGDTVYGKPSDRLYLHACELEITIPGLPHNDRKIFQAPTPDDFMLQSTGE